MYVRPAERNFEACTQPNWFDQVSLPFLWANKKEQTRQIFIYNQTQCFSGRLELPQRRLRFSWRA